MVDEVSDGVAVLQGPNGTNVFSPKTSPTPSRLKISRAAMDVVRRIPVLSPKERCKSQHSRRVLIKSKPEERG